ncbi:hypothetical protein H9Q72_010460 [Fusarium xylarioides]|uniref:Uncharacterized protein n=1 Tax=Fusarium xylarioides TaxID=221167 RepID=A0A9P7HKX2_9HYPO|nr:hypothetical protein H9Q72_010460 [Fusarium xylarioides]
MISKYFTSSEDPNHPSVETLIAQIDESIETSAVGFRAVWDFRVFFTKAVGFRTFVLLLYSIFQQWGGGGIIGLYMDPALQTIGITKKLDVLGITLGLTATYFVFTLFGAYIIEFIFGAAGVVHNYGISVRIQKVGYKIWAVYIAYNLIQLIVAYFIFPETGKLNLEEIDHIFETKNTNPTKLSVKIADAKWASIKEEKRRTRNNPMVA